MVLLMDESWLNPRYLISWGQLTLLEKRMPPFEQMFNIMKKPWAIALYAALVVLSYFFVDKSLATFFHQHDIRTHWYLLKILTTFGANIIYFGLFFLAGLYFRYNKKAQYEAKAWYLLACVVVPCLVCIVLKVSLGRARPDLLFSSNIFGFYLFKFHPSYWSLPSGHTTTVISLAAGMGVLFPKYFYALLSFALIVVLTRVFLYYHYLSDVMTGFYLSILVVGLLTHYLKKNKYLSAAWVK